MVKRYDESSIDSTNDAKLCLMDLAEFGLGDGMRFVFLLSEQGLIYEATTYNSFTKDTTLKEVEQYIQGKMS